MTHTFLALTQVPLLVPTLTCCLVLLPPLPSLSNVCIIHMKQRPVAVLAEIPSYRLLHHRKLKYIHKYLKNNVTP